MKDRLKRRGRILRLLALPAVLILSALAAYSVAQASSPTFQPAGHRIVGISGNARFSIGGWEVKCPQSLFSGTTANPATGTVGLSLPRFQSASSGACTGYLGESSPVSTHQTWSLAASGSEKASLVYSGAEALTVHIAPSCELWVGAAGSIAGTWHAGVLSFETRIPVKVPSTCPAAIRAEEPTLFFEATYYVDDMDGHTLVSLS